MLDEQAREDLIEKITAIFTNEAEAGKLNEDPDAYVAEHLPEGTEGADVAAALPSVGERTGLDFSNVASTGGPATAAGQLSYTYETIYQQNTFIYAEEGAQVTNIQGDGNAVAQQQVDVDIDLEYGKGETEHPVEEPVEPVILKEGYEEGYEDAGYEGDHDGGYDGSGINPGGVYDEPTDEPWDPAEDLPEVPEAAEVPEAPEAPAEAPMDAAMDV